MVNVFGARSVGVLLCIGAGLVAVNCGDREPSPLETGLRRQALDGGFIIPGPTGPFWTSLGPRHAIRNTSCSPQAEELAPPISGRATVLAVSPHNRHHVWLGTAGGGVWVTNHDEIGSGAVIADADFGPGWSPVWTPHNRGFDSLAIGAIVLDPDDCDADNNGVCDTAYVGTGENSLRRDTYYGDGVYRVHLDRGSSGDVTTGPTWEFTRLDAQRQFRYGSTTGLVLDQDSLYVALGPGNTTTGVHATVRAPRPDAGYGVHHGTEVTPGMWSWSPILETPSVGTEGWDDLLVPTDLEQDPEEADRLFVGIMNDGVFRYSKQTASWCALNPGSRLLEASQSGAISTTITDCSLPGGLPSGLPRRGRLADPNLSDDDRFDHVEIAIEQSPCVGTECVVYALLGRCPSGPPEAPGDLINDLRGGTLICKESTGGALLLPRLFRSDDGGTTWKEVSGLPTISHPSVESYADNGTYSRYTHALEVFPGNPNDVIWGGLTPWRLRGIAASGSGYSVATAQKMSGAHLDAHDFYIDPQTVGLSEPFILGATDGGFYLRDTGGFWSGRNFGLVTTQFHGIGIDHEDEDPSDGVDRTTGIIGGLQDNSTFAYNGSPDWTLWDDGGDGGEAIVQTPTITYDSQQINLIRRTPGLGANGTAGASGLTFYRRPADGEPDDIIMPLFPSYLEHEQTKRLFVATDIVSVRGGTVADWEGVLDCCREFTATGQEHLDAGRLENCLQYQCPEGPKNDPTCDDGSAGAAEPSLCVIDVNVSSGNLGVQLDQPLDELLAGTHVIVQNNPANDRLEYSQFSTTGCSVGCNSPDCSACTDTCTASQSQNTPCQALIGTPEAIQISPVFDPVRRTSAPFNAIETPHNVTTALAVAPSHGWRIYVGLYDGQLWRSTTSPSQQPTPDMSDWMPIHGGALPSATIGTIAVHPADEQAVWVGFSDFIDQPVWFSPNGGQSWEQRSGDPADPTTRVAEPVKVIKVDPDSPAKLWAGTDTGVFFSDDSGMTWAKYNNNLPRVPVFDIEIDRHNNRIIAATHGRGVFIAEDVDLPLVTVFEGWTEDGIWDIPIHGTGFTCSQDRCLCDVEVIDQNGIPCASTKNVPGNNDVLGREIHVTPAGDLTVDNIGSCTRCNGQPVVFACFNNDCVGGAKLNQECNGVASAVRIECAENDPVEMQVNDKCPEQFNPPSSLITVNPELGACFNDLPPTMPLAGAAAISPGSFRRVLIAPTMSASPPNGGDRTLCTAVATYSSDFPQGDVQLALRDAVASSPSCVEAGVYAYTWESPDGQPTGEDRFSGPDLRVGFGAPSLQGAQLIAGFSARPGEADQTCFNLSRMGVFLGNQLGIAQIRFLTPAQGAAGGQIILSEHSSTGSCTMQVATTSGQSGEDIAAAIAAAFQAPGSPQPLTCPESSNPRDIVHEGDSVIAILPTSIDVCIADSAIGLTVGPHGVEIPVVSDAWPMFGHDAQRRARSLLTGPTTNDIAWEVSVNGDVKSSPAVDADGAVYFGSDGNRVYAYNADGTQKWPPVQTGGDVRSSPALSEDGFLYVGSDDDHLYKIDMSSGDVIWTFDVDLNIRSSPAIGTNGTIYFGANDNRIYALRPDRSVRWSFRTGGNITASPALGPDGTVYVGSHDEHLYALRDDDGLTEEQREIWSVDLGGDIDAAPAVGPGPNPVIYVGSDDDELFAVDSTTGSVLWSAPTAPDRDIETSVAIDAAGNIYFGSDNNQVRAVDPQGNTLWTFHTGGDVESSPALGADGVLYVGSEDDHVYALLTAPGLDEASRLVWKYDTDRDVDSSPAIGLDGMLFVGSDDNKLHAFKTP